MKIVITQEDCINAPYVHAADCPIARALNKALNTKVTFFLTTVNDLKTTKKIGKIDPSFNAKDYKMLKSGEIKEFVTEYTPNT